MIGNGCEKYHVSLLISFLIKYHRPCRTGQGLDERRRARLMTAVINDLCLRCDMILSADTRFSARTLDMSLTDPPISPFTQLNCYFRWANFSTKGSFTTQIVCSIDGWLIFIFNPKIPSGKFKLNKSQHNHLSSASMKNGAIIFQECFN